MIGWTIIPIVFGPLEKRETTVDACVRQLEEAILGGSLLPGGKLPAERKLAETLGVNRVTVRSALARLETAGLVTVRQGSGYRVEDYRERGGPDLILKLVGEAEGRQGEAVIARDLLAMRRQLASVVLSALTDSVGDDSLVELEGAVDTLAEAAESGSALLEIAKHDANVLKAIVKATGSDVFTLFMNALNQSIVDFTRLRGALYSDLTQTVGAYRQLLLWLQTPYKKSIVSVVEAMQRRDDAVMERFEASS